MKSFLSKNWKKILIIIAIIFIVLNMINKCIAPHILVEEYAKYGRDVEASNISVYSSEFLAEAREAAPVPDDIFRLLIILVGGILIVVIISELASKKSSAKKK